MSDLLRFTSKCAVPDESGCVRWLAAVDRNGYGVFSMGGRPRAAHRASWQLHRHADIAPGLVVRHKCDHPWCVNPDHLEVGTRADNNRDRDERGRTHRGERTGGAKLSTDKVLDILAEPGTTSHTHLAKKYGVGIVAIYNVRTRKTWAHVPGEAVTKVTLADRLERFFSENPAVYVDGKDLAGIAGTYAWRTRLSEVRQRFKARGGDIVNRQRRGRVNGTTRTYVVSEYMAVLPERVQ